MDFCEPLFADKNQGVISKNVTPLQSGWSTTCSFRAKFKKPNSIFKRCSQLLCNKLKILRMFTNVNYCARKIKKSCITLRKNIISTIRDGKQWKCCK